jgi:lipoprotein-releasing system permease protein
MRYELMVGLRYTRARRRNRFVGVNSAVSMIGIALGVWALIVIMSVMNGLQQEVRGRILGVAAHVQVLGPAGRLADWQGVAGLAAGQPHVLAAAPFVEAQSLLSAGRAVRPAIVRGILPEQEARVVELGKRMRGGTLEVLRPGEFQVVLGADLARSLGALPGDKVALIAPQGIVTPAGVLPRLKQFTVAGVFDAGIQEADSRLALVHLADAQVLYRMGQNVSGVRLKLDDLFAARGVASALQERLPPGATALDWTRSHAAFFHAVELEKRVMFIILGLVVLVAAINIVSTLVVAVADRQSDIAILRTVGAAPGSVVRIFMVQGMLIGVIGTVAGLATGILTALNIDVIVPAIENAFRFKIFAKDVYLIPDLPSQLQAGDVAAVVLMALLLSFLATIYPSWRAARVNPAEALRYE